MLKLSQTFFPRCQYLLKDNCWQSSRHSKTASRWELSLEPRFVILFVLSWSLYFIAGSIGSGWIFLISASLFTVLITGFCLPVMVLASIATTLKPQQQAIAGQSMLISVELSPKRHNLLFPPLLWLIINYKLYHKNSHKGNLTGKSIFVESLQGQVAGQVIRELNWMTEPAQRGSYINADIVLESAFPLGVVWWRRYITFETNTIVYPKSLSLDGTFLRDLQKDVSNRMLPASTLLPSTYTRSIREYVCGDSPRIIHWATSARMNKLMVREFDKGKLPGFDVFLDLASGWTTQEQLELAITTTSSLLTLGYRLSINPMLYLPLPTQEANPLLSAEAFANLAYLDTQMTALANIEFAAWNKPSVSCHALNNSVLNDGVLNNGINMLLVVASAEKVADTSCENIFVIEIAAARNSKKTNAQLAITAESDIASL